MNYGPLMLFMESEQEKRLAWDRIRRKKERGPGVMPTEFLKEFIGQVCEITMVDGMGAVAMLVAAEGNWLKIEENGKNKLVNGDLVRSITAMPEKYQERYQEKARKKQER